MRLIVTIALALGALALPAAAANYPVSGKWGVSTSSEKGKIDCTDKRVIAFNGNQRTDSNGGVRAYRNKSVSGGPTQFRIVDVFSNGQVNNASVRYTLGLIDDDHIVMHGQTGTLKLRRCE